MYIKTESNTLSRQVYKLIVKIYLLKGFSVKLFLFTARILSKLSKLLNKY